MRIGNNMEVSQNDIPIAAKTTTNYSKADISRAIRLDITDIGKDTGLIIDQGRSIQDVVEQAGALDVQTQTDYMVVMSNTMSEEDYARMCKEGFNPSEMTGEESVTILDHIKAVMAQSGEVVAGFNDDLDMAKLEAITGSKADANTLSKVMKQADIPFDETNAKKINEAAREILEVDELNDSSIRYMLTGGLKPTIENIYLANFSAAGSGNEQATGYYSLGMQGYLARKADASDVSAIMPDIQKTVENFELEDIDKDTAVKEATWLVEKGLDITKSNIVKLDELMNVTLPKDYEEACKRAAFALEKGDEPKKADISKENISVYEKAADVLKTANEISDEQVANVVTNGQKLNIRNLQAASISVSMTAVSGNIQVSNGQALLQEVRLQMTLEANVSMLKRGFEIDTMPLTRLVEELKSTQQSIDNVLTPDAKEQTALQGASLFRSTRQALSEIPYMPAAVIGRIKLEQEYSLTTVHETGTDLKARYEVAGQSYETLMTAPRKDMGDAISKAFRNVDDILKDMGIETDEANRKAVRILGYNSMEINEASIIRIREATDKVMNAVNALTPAKTLELIRQGINPMDMNIDELTQVLSRLTPDEADEKYSKFLYKLEKSSNINESEREAYIGIYRLVNRLEKTDGAAIGALVNSDREITFKSLLSGMRSRKVSFDENIDDNYGFLNDTIRKGVSISDQIEQAFAGVIGKGSNERLEEQYLRESYKEYNEQLEQNMQAAKELESNGEPVTLSNMVASNALTGSDSVFRMMKDYSKKVRETQDNDTAEKYDNAVDSLIEGFEDRDSAKQAYDNVIELGKQIIEEVRYTAEDTIDLKRISLMHKQLSIAGSRGDRENYTVPLQINGEVTSINLTLRHEEGVAGEVDVSFDSDSFGRVTAHFSVDGEAHINGMFVTEKKEGLEPLRRVSEAMASNTDLVTDFRVIQGRENRSFGDKIFASDADISNVDTKTLYGLAKDFMVQLSRL